MDRASLNPAGLRRREFATSLFLACLARGAAAQGPDRNVSCATSPQRGIIWQPWAAHAGLDPAGWQALGREVLRQNYTHVLVQWSSYGDYEFWPRQQTGWMADGMQHWRGTGLKLVLGLHMGEDYYRVLQQPDADLRVHLSGTVARSVAQAREILRHPPVLEVEGWYLPQEIDDLHWRSRARQAMLRNYLSALVDRLGSLTPAMAGAPIYASAFFSGASTPDEFAHLLRELHRATGVIWLVQDGLGAGRMDEARTAGYLNAVAQTLPPAGWRGLLEVFDEQRVEGAPPRYEPSAPDTIARRDALWCASTGRHAAVVFSLNQCMKELLPTA